MIRDDDTGGVGGVEVAERRRQDRWRETEKTERGQSFVVGVPVHSSCWQATYKPQKWDLMFCK